MDAGSDIVDFKDKAAIESFDDTSMDVDEMNQTTDNNIESLMNEIDTTPGIGVVTLDAKPEVANEGNASEIESIFNAEGVNPSELSDTSENISEGMRGTLPEISDISALMDENDIDDSTKPISGNEESLSSTFEAQEESKTDLNGADDIPFDETAEESDEVTEMMEDSIHDNFAGPILEKSLGVTETPQSVIGEIDQQAFTADEGVAPGSRMGEIQTIDQILRDTPEESLEEEAQPAQNDLKAIEEQMQHDYPEIANRTLSREKALKRNEFDLLRFGNDAINQRLEAKADDYRDKGLNEKEIAERLAADKWEYQKEFLDDAFPSEDVSPNVFNGFNEHGARDRIDEMEHSASLREVVTNRDNREYPSQIQNAEGIADDASRHAASSVDSKFNAENDVPVIPRTSDLDRKIIDIFPEGRRAAIDAAFADVPTELIESLNNYSGGLNNIKDSGYSTNEYGILVKDGCYYEDGSDTITMNEHMTDAEYAEVFPHEFGHYVDCQRGWESTGTDFVEAVKKDVEMYDRNTPEGNMRFHDMLDDAFSTGAAYDRAVTDILSALFKNDPDVIKRFEQEGMVGSYYRHDDEYWNNQGMREKEIYANNMAIQVSQTRIGKNFIERWFGHTDSCFRGKFGLESKAEV